MSEMNKVSGILTEMRVADLRQTITRSNQALSTTLPDQPDPERLPAAVAAIKAATELASSILWEISNRWPAQAGHWAKNSEMVAAWGRGIFEDGAAGPILKRALADLSAKPYPPDLGALLAVASGADGGDTEQQFYLAARAAGCNPPSWQNLGAATYSAAMSMAAAGFDLKTLTWDRLGVRQAWTSFYSQACRREAAGEVLPVPPALDGALPQKTDREAFQAARGGIFAAIGLTPPAR